MISAFVAVATVFALLALSLGGLLGPLLTIAIVLVLSLLYGLWILGYCGGVSVVLFADWLWSKRPWGGPCCALCWTHLEKATVYTCVYCKRTLCGRSSCYARGITGDVMCTDCEYCEAVT
jgi:hypothetical protein